MAFLLGFLLWLLVRKTPKKMYAKAASSHRKGESYYSKRDYEMADAHYKKAEKYRQKAREMERKNA